MSFYNDPNKIQLSIISDGVSKKYILTKKQSDIYSQLNMEYKGLVVNNHIITLAGLLIGSICVILLIFDYTRKYAFLCLCITFLIWILHTTYTHYKGKQIYNEINELLNSLEI